MEFKSFTCGFLQNEAYLVWSDTLAVLFDAPFGSFKVVSEFLNNYNLKLSSIILTHTHFDHILDLGKFRENYQCKIYVHPEDEYRLLEPMEHIPQGMPFNLDPVIADEKLSDGQLLKIGKMQFRILHTPGHTKGGVCIELIGEKKIITGDTLFRAGIGRTDFTGGDLQTIETSIREKLYSYPDDFEIYPGHGPKSTIGFEKMDNPYVRN